ncbi:di- and tripeptidase, putative [Babesia ovis]|uniref:Di- and tripeptidase, putative n=1 Tax=Babesia ovis TaxID=5869 RepID=A0A9W5T9Y2_BABOV|nr:di- and tripeptidase, putative [Babesia ovis]
MHRDIRSLCDISSIAVDDRFVFLGILGADSSTAIFDQQTLEFIGLFKYMCGSITKLLSLREFNKLVCLTSAGYLYIWDTSEETIARLKRITHDPLTLDGFVHPDVRVNPVAAVTPASLDECVDVDHIPGTSLLVSLDSSGELTFVDIHTGVKKGSCRPIESGNGLLCIKVQTVVTTFRGKKGHFAAIGGTKGQVIVVFLPIQDDMVDVNDIYTLCEKTADCVDLVCVDFRRKLGPTSSITLVAGCSDGSLRCLVYKHTDDELVSHKSASYVHCRAARKGHINRILALCDDGNPYAVSLCTMQLSHDFYTPPVNSTKPLPADSSTFCTEIILQTLLPDQCDSFGILAQVREFVVDIAVGANSHSILYATSDEIFVIRRSTESKQWLKPQKMEWLTPENRKLMTKLM